MTEEIREKIGKAMPPVNCETCYLHSPGNYTREDCITYGKRPCALERVCVDQILSIKTDTCRVAIVKDISISSFNKMPWGEGKKTVLRAMLDAGYRQVVREEEP